jgi:hypothetical protein
MTEKLIKCKVTVGKLMLDEKIYKKGEIVLMPEAKAKASISVTILEAPEPEKEPEKEPEPVKAPEQEPVKEPEKEPEVVKLNKGGRPAKKV